MTDWSDCAAAAAPVAVLLLCLGMMSAWVQAIKADGPLSCYQGFSVAVLSMAAYKALYFGLYDTAKLVLLPQVIAAGVLLQHAGLAGCAAL